MRIRATHKWIRARDLPYESEMLVQAVVVSASSDNEWPEENELQEIIAERLGYNMTEEEVRRAARGAFEAGYLELVDEDSDDFI